MSSDAEIETKDVVSLKEDTASVRQVETTLMGNSTSDEDTIFLDGFSAKEQNRIFRKVDFHIVPMLMLLYLFANLDRCAMSFALSMVLFSSLHVAGMIKNRRSKSNTIPEPDQTDIVVLNTGQISATPRLKASRPALACLAATITLLLWFSSSRT